MTIMYIQRQLASTDGCRYWYLKQTKTKNIYIMITNTTFQVRTKSQKLPSSESTFTTDQFGSMSICGMRQHTIHFMIEPSHTSENIKIKFRHSTQSSWQSISTHLIQIKPVHSLWLHNICILFNNHHILNCVLFLDNPDQLIRHA